VDVELEAVRVVYPLYHLSTYLFLFYLLSLENPWRKFK
jgi:hypothetical protein